MLNLAGNAQRQIEIGFQQNAGYANITLTFHPVFTFRNGAGTAHFCAEDGRQFMHHIQIALRRQTSSYADDPFGFAQIDAA